MSTDLLRVDGIETVTCPSCDGQAPRASIEASDTLAHICECGWREDRCECGVVMTFSAVMRGVTCGGLSFVGARECVPCGVVEVCKRSAPADAVDWSLAKGGRSLNAGGIKLRAEKGNDGDIAALMDRLARLPALELEVARLLALLGKRMEAV